MGVCDHSNKAMISEATTWTPGEGNKAEITKSGDNDSKSLGNKAPIRKRVEGNKINVNSNEARGNTLRSITQYEGNKADNEGNKADGHKADDEGNRAQSTTKGEGVKADTEGNKAHIKDNDVTTT